jgi:hypothetical protein
MQFSPDILHARLTCIWRHITQSSLKQVRFLYCWHRAHTSRHYRVFQKWHNLSLAETARFVTVKQHNKLVYYILIHIYVNCGLEEEGSNYSDKYSTLYSNFLKIFATPQPAVQSTCITTQDKPTYHQWKNSPKCQSTKINKAVEPVTIMESFSLIKPLHYMNARI